MCSKCMDYCVNTPLNVQDVMPISKDEVITCFNSPK